MELYVGPGGSVRCLYGEALDLAALGPLQISRASHVEPDGEGRWHADLAPVGGPALGPFERRSEALAAEVAWLARHHLAGPTPARAGGNRPLDIRPRRPIDEVHDDRHDRAPGRGLAGPGPDS